MQYPVSLFLWVICSFLVPSSLLSPFLKSSNHAHFLAQSRSQLIHPNVSLANFTGWDPLQFATVYTALRGVVLDTTTAPLCPDPTLEPSHSCSRSQLVKFVAYAVDNQDHMLDYERHIVALASLNFSNYQSKMLHIMEHQNLTAHLLDYLAGTNGTEAQTRAVLDASKGLNHVHIIISEHFPDTLDALLAAFPDPRLPILYATYQLLEMVKDFKAIGLHHYMFRAVNFRFSHKDGDWKTLQLKVLDFEKTEFSRGRRCGYQTMASPELTVCKYAIEGYTTYMFNVGETILDIFHLYDNDVEVIKAKMAADRPEGKVRLIKFMFMYGLSLPFMSLMHPGYDYSYMQTFDQCYIHMLSYELVKRAVADKVYGENYVFSRVDISQLKPQFGVLFVDLMQKLIAFHPNERIRLEDALVHPYFDELHYAFFPIPPLLDAKS